MDVQGRVGCYIWWLRKHHSQIPYSQIRREVECNISDLRFFHLITSIPESLETIYLQELQMFDYDVPLYEAYLADGKPPLTEEWPRSFEADRSIDFIQDGFGESCWTYNY